MNVKKTMKKIVALGTGAAMVGATIMGAAAYDLADYPAKYIEDGVFSGKIVVGEAAATSDVLGAIDIAASLQTESVSTTPVEVDGQTGSVTLTGDAFKLETSSDLLEVHEIVGNVYDTLTDSELDALGGGTITTDEGTTDYNQYLRFADSTSTTLQKMAVNYVEDEDNVLGDFLVIADDLPFFEWELEFTEGLESATSGSTATLELSDLEDEVINIFGSDFTIVRTQINTTSNAITLTFMSGDVSSTMREGETKTFTLDGVEYEVSLIFVSDPSTKIGTNEAKFMVNGETTDSLQDGETDTLSGGLQIGVRDLLVNSREGVVEFFLGANKVEFTDTNYGNTAFDGSVEINNENIEDADVDVVVNEIGSSGAEITNIKYRLKADASVGSTLYIPPEHGVREYLDEPEGLLSPTFDIRYEGLTSVETNDIKLNARSDHSYDLTITNLRGKTYDFPYITNKNSVFKFGDDDDDFVFLEPNVNTTGGSSSAPMVNITSAALTVGDDDYFVLSEHAVASGSEKDDSSVLRYEDIDTSDRVLTFTDMSTGDEVTVTYTANTTNSVLIGVATNFVVEGNTYTIWVGNSTHNYSLAIDLDGDGTLVGDRVGFTVRGGGVLDFASKIDGSAPTSADVGSWQSISASDADHSVNMTLTTPSNQFDDSSLGGDKMNWTIDSDTTAQVHLSIAATQYNGPLDSTAAYNDFDIINDDSADDYDRGLTDYGAMIEYYNPTGTNDAEELTISYPTSQRGVQVFVTAGATERSESSSSVTTEVVNPIAVGMAVLDVNAPAVGSENLIVVGGPCINTVAAELMGNPAVCTDGFTAGKALIKSWDSGSKVSLLVAGYSADDTLGAAYVLADYTDYALDGEEVEVVVADLNDLTVQAVTPVEEEMPAEETPAEE